MLRHPPGERSGLRDRRFHPRDAVATGAPYLRAADPVLARLIDDRPAFDPQAWLAQLPPMDLYGALLFQVTGQQLSVPRPGGRLLASRPSSTAIFPRPLSYWE